MIMRLKVEREDLILLELTPEWIIVAQKRNITSTSELFGPLGHFKSLINKNYISSIDMMDSFIDLCESLDDVDLIMALTKIIQKRI